MTATCRVCGETHTDILADFGLQPNSLRLLESPKTPHRFHPLILSTCPVCDFVFIAEPMPPEEFYGEVQLSTSIFPARHLDALSDELARRLATVADPLVFEIGCNDGAFLERLRGKGLSRLFGVEPAEGCARLARERKLTVETGYFSGEAAREFLSRHGRPNLVVCRHVLEHVPGLDDFLSGIALLLGDTGLLLLEMPDLAAIEAKGDFSAIWEQHVNYFDLPVLTRLLARFGLGVSEQRRLDYGGGTLLAFVAPGRSVPATPTHGRAALKDILARYIAEFHTAVAALSAKGARIAAFGAGMRGAMLINLSGVAGMLDYVVDDNPSKVGRYLSGSLLPICASRALYEDRPDVCIVLPMNSKEMEWGIMERHQAFVQAGGRFMEVLPSKGGIAWLRD